MMDNQELKSEMEALSELMREPTAESPKQIRPKIKSWVIGAAILVLGAIPLIYVGFEYKEKPYRSLRTFPISTYLQDDRSATGGIFSIHVEVAAYLGSKDGVGRLFAFKIKDLNDSVPILVPDKFASLSLTKGEEYFAAIHVNDQGVIYADYFSKD